MEFHEKLQALRKQKGLTQDELAQILYVSRAAVSKWDSGRGYPSIDSLKQISTYFSITLDDLLSSEEVLTIAEENHKNSTTHLRDLVFGLLDLAVALFLFLPFFGEISGSTVQEVSLLLLSNTPPYLLIAYFVIVLVSILWGILILTLQNCRNPLWQNIKNRVSLLLNIIGTLLFIISKQPYAATFLFVFLVIKVLLYAKKL